MSTPADMPGTLHSIKEDVDRLDAPLRRSLTEVEIIMQRHLDQGYSTNEAIQLTDITLANVVVP